MWLQKLMNAPRLLRSQKITILQAVRWIGEAWKKVSPDTIKNVLDYLVYWTATFK